jgi:uncharacterized membrane protein
MELATVFTAINFSIWIHITAVVVGLGTTFAESVLFPVAMGSDPKHLPYVHRLQITINRYFATPALVVILITGIYQVAQSPYNYSFSEFWISATFLIVLIIGGLNGAYFIPTDKRLEKMVTDEIAASGDGPFTPSEEYLAQSKVEGMVGAFTGILIVIAVFLMVFKPGM